MNALDHDLLTAARTGDTDGVRTAIEGGARVDARDEELRTPLRLAVHGDRVEAARLLVAAGADPDAQDRREESPWLATGVTGSVAMPHVRLEAVILGDGGRAHLEVVEELLAAGATPGLPDGDGDGDGGAALAHAERRGFAELAALLRAAA